jgi:DNA repair exonuclease SbcCD ATPase subunit
MVGERDVYKLKQLDLIKEEESLTKRLAAAEKARSVIQEVAKKTQQNLEFHIGHIVTMAISAIWDDPFEFQIEFVNRRNKTECDLWLSRDGEKIPPVEATGGGLCDVVSFALRLVYWSLNKTSPVMILDEPFKFLSPNLQSRASSMLKLLSTKLGIQFIVISHADDAISDADKVIKFSLDPKGITRTGDEKRKSSMPIRAPQVETNKNENVRKGSRTFKR